jgi:hypothetical protein
MPLPQLPHNIRYKVTPEDTGITLCIWETASVTESRINPFLFKLNYRLSSEAEVQTVLNCCLSLLS